MPFMKIGNSGFRRGKQKNYESAMEKKTSGGGVIPTTTSFPLLHGESWERTHHEEGCVWPDRYFCLRFERGEREHPDAGGWKNRRSAGDPTPDKNAEARRKTPPMWPNLRRKDLPFFEKVWGGKQAGYTSGFNCKVEGGRSGGGKYYFPLGF